MTQNSFRLSVEELALAFSQIGNPNLGQELLGAQLAIQDPAEIRARLLSAGHSLLARGWLGIDSQGHFYLDDALARIARVLAHADFSLRFSRAARGIEFELTLHFGERGIFAHQLEQGVVHVITELADPAEATATGLRFFELTDAMAFTIPPVEIANAMLEQLKDMDDAAGIAERLANAGVPTAVAALLAPDLARASYRGSILRIEYTAANAPVSERGVLVLRGAERLWLMRPFQRAQATFLTLAPGTTENLTSEIYALLKPI